VFALISAIFTLLFFPSTLPNGIRLVELPPGADSVEIVAGYTSGGLSGFASTAAAKALMLDAYSAGATIDFLNEIDRTAVRIRAAKWAAPMLTDRLPSLFKEVPKSTEGSTPSSPNFRAKVEEEIQNALVGPRAPAVDYATDDAFVLISSPAPDSLRDALAAIPKRASANRPEDVIERLPAERTFRFKSDIQEGGVIFASPVPSVYYRQWYLILLLDRLIHHGVRLPLKTTLPLTVRSYYYRVELPVPPGQLPEPAEENLLQELQRLQFTAANAKDLAAARQEALAYLDSNPVREWFASHDIASRREEGMQWLQAMSSDDMRLAARDLLIMNRVLVTWSPKPKQTAVSSEPLTPVGAVGEARAGRSQSAPTETRPQVWSEGKAAPFPAHNDRTFSTPLPERLTSGVSIVTSTASAVFISGGPFTRFDHELTAEDLKPFQQYRADRILVLSTASAMDRARQIWGAFKGNANGETVLPKGSVPSGNLSALFVLKTILDLKVMESGWWPDAMPRIDAGDGSNLQIRASDEKRQQILDWIKAIANTPLADPYFAWAREVAVHHFESVLPHLQALTWERDAKGTVQDPATVSAKHVQDVARIYF